MLKKILRILLIIFVLALLAFLGWICQLLYDWPFATIYLWPISGIVLWFTFFFIRKAWIKHRAEQRLKTQLPPAEMAPTDADWVKGVRELLALNRNQGSFAADINLTDDLPYLRRVLVYIDEVILDILNGHRFQFFLDFEFVERFLANRHKKIVEMLEANQVESLSGIPFISDLLDKKGVKKSALGTHRLHFIMGLPGSGKSTLLQRSSYGLQVGDADPDAPVLPTQSCRFAFLNAGIAIEIAGKHVDPLQDASERDRDWNSLLASIEIDASPHQISSVTICISPDSLSPVNVAETLRGMQIIRQRVTDLMQISGRRLPIYLMCTHIDEIGMTNLLRILPDNLLSQAAGSLLPIDHVAIQPGEAREAVSEITRYLPWLALRSAAQGCNPQDSALLATNGLFEIEENFDAIITALFSASNYLEAPIYRGLFLSGDLAAAGIDNSDKKPDSPRLGFGSGFLNRILVEDRIFQPLSSYERRLKNRRKLAWFSYYSLISLLAVWLFSGFIYRVEEANAFKANQFPATPQVGSPADDYVQSVTKMLPYIAWVENRDISSWSFYLPFAGPGEEIEERIKQRFIMNYTAFNELVLKVNFEKVAPILVGPNNRFLGVVLEALIDRLRILESAYAGESLLKVKLLREPSPIPMTQIVQGVSPADAKTISMLVYYFAFWNDKATINKYLDDLSVRLERVALQDPNFSWVMPWAALQPSVNDVWLTDFWAPTTTPKGEKVYGPFTKEGKIAIREFLQRMQSIKLLDRIFGYKINDYLKIYDNEREAEWRRFAMSFDQGSDLLLTEGAWLQILSTFRGRESPYRRLVERIYEEFPADGSLGDRPSWVSASNLITVTRIAVTKESFFGAIKSRIEVLKAAGRLNASNNGVLLDTKALQEDGKVFAVYGDAVVKVLPQIMASGASAGNLAIQFSGLGRDTSIKESDLKNAWDALRRYEEKIKLPSQPWNEPTWVLLRGPLHTMTKYTYKQASCTMQSEWNNNVIYPTKLGATEVENFEKTYGSQGTLWKFIDQTAKPFITVDGSDFKNIATNGWALQWQENFINFLDNAAGKKRARDAAIKKAELEDKLANARDRARLAEVEGRIDEINRQQEKFNSTNYVVKLASQPVQTTGAASQLPFGVGLTLNCSSGAQIMTQLNFKTLQTFNWNPNTCGDTELKIFIGKTAITKVWPGKYGFGNFLNEFRSGKSSYSAKSFPDKSELFSQFNIQKIDVSFVMVGAPKALADSKQSQSDVADLSAYMAEKNKLIKDLADRQLRQINAEILALSASNAGLIIPEKIAMCPF
jgi:type VI secretion system protein ImpL